MMHTAYPREFRSMRVPMAKDFDTVVRFAVKDPLGCADLCPSARRYPSKKASLSLFSWASSQMGIVLFLAPDPKLFLIQTAKSFDPILSLSVVLSFDKDPLRPHALARSIISFDSP